MVALVLNRFIILLFCGFAFLSDAYSQSQANSWIDHAQYYYRFNITKDGIYRIYSNSLMGAGINVDAILMQKFQIFSKGEEIPIYIKYNTTTGILEYIEFYGEKNTGWLDTAIYKLPEYQANPYFSLYNDTATYFLTWNQSLDNLRITDTNDVSFDNYPTQEFCLTQEFLQFSNVYYNADNTSFIGSGEGWFDGSMLSTGVSRNVSLPTTNVKASYSSTLVEVVLVGISNSNHIVNCTLNGYQLFTKEYFGRTHTLVTTSAPSGLLSNSNTFSFSIGSSATDNNSLAYISVIYPHSFDFENKTSFHFLLPAGTSKSTLEISGFNGGTSPVLYDLTGKSRIKLVKIGSNYKAVINSLNKKKDFYLCADNEVSNLPTPTKIEFVDYSTVSFNSDYIIISHPSLWNGASAYKTYRESKGYTVNLVNVEELYNQFAYGINKHPMAIKNFLNFVLEEYDSPPKYLFLIGKSYYLTDYRNLTGYFSASLVPSCGNPPSDMLYSVNSVTEDFIPKIATGRLSARSNEDVMLYLDKMEAYESNLPAPWMKNILHFTGGNGFAEQTQFQDYLFTLEQIIEDTLFAGNVTPFAKNSSDPIQITISDTIQNLINSGTTLLTFFGHAFSGGFDQDIDDPSSYTNHNKYPFFIANSCYSGDVFAGASISEQWVIIEDKGAIGFLASVSEAFQTPLYKFSKEVYKNIAWKNYGGAIGQSIINTCTDLLASEGISIVSTNLDFILHCDPALVLNSFDLPDLYIDQSSISFTPQVVSAEVDSFQVNIKVDNFGRGIADTFDICVKRHIPDGSVIEKSYSMTGCNYSKTAYVKFGLDHLTESGINTFDVTIDYLNTIDELTKSNNTASAVIYISSTEVIPVYPPEYAIIPNSTVTLYGSTGNAFLPSQTISFQLDTTDLFNPPLAVGSVDNIGGTIGWQSPFTLIDSTVYYWRIGVLDQTTSTMKWRNSSFIHIFGKSGWSQAHNYQFRKDEYNLLEHDVSNHQFNFVSVPKELHVHTFGSGSGFNPFEVGFEINGGIANGLGDYDACWRGPAIMVVVIDTLTQKAWPSDRVNAGHVNYPGCRTFRDDFYFIFYSNDSYFPALINFLTYTIPDGYYVAIYTFGNANLPSWPENLYQAIEGLTTSPSPLKMRNVANNEPYIFVGKKGTPNFDDVTGSSVGPIELYTILEHNFNYGDMTSTLIGPAVRWDQLHWKQHASEVNSLDQIELTVSGITSGGMEEILIEDITPSTTLYNLDSIDANQYPYLRLKLYSVDTSTLTPSQLEKWQIYYEDVPETAINPNKGFCFYKDTLLEGETLLFTVATENISSKDMDSLLIGFWHTDPSNTMQQIGLKRYRTHPSGDILLADTVHLSTTGFAGLNRIWLEVNPITASGTYDQPEQFHFNNIAELFFYVQADKTNPLLDVTFDGLHIMDGDLVSAKPEILIRLKDENKFLELNDPASFTLFLLSPGDEVEQIIQTESPEGSLILWKPAELPDNSCELVYTPEFKKDGIYRLRVQAKDKSQNESGSNDYLINFTINTKPSISNVFNYPNPFSTATRFVFELSGSEVPADFNIQILTITGKLVRTITGDELGNVHIGRNISEYAWDGRDMFGDQLANGIYLYWINCRIDGEEIDKMDTRTDQYFNKGYGKMFLMR